VVILEDIEEDDGNGNSSFAIASTNDFCHLQMVVKIIWSRTVNGFIAHAKLPMCIKYTFAPSMQMQDVSIGNLYSAIKSDHEYEELIAHVNTRFHVDCFPFL